MAEIAIAEVGARNNKSDQQLIQTMHDSASALGASCGGEGLGESGRFPLATQQDFDAILTLTESKGFRIPAKESAGAVNPPGLRLVECGSSFVSEIPLAEAARTNYPVLLISAGTGTKAHYSAKVLERDGPKVAKPGTLMFWNHPTKAEEAARPEGNLDNLAAILTGPARWDANGPKGPGLYGDAKVMADYAEKVAERAPHIGLSIRGGGTGTGKLIDGVPELASLDYLESVDYVTKAGRGGLALAEAARNAGVLPQEESMAGITAEEAKVMIQEAVGRAVAPYQTRLLESDARAHAAELLESVSLPPIAKRKIIDRAVVNLPRVDGALDLPKFREVVVAEAKAEGEYLAIINPAMAGRVTGMGTPAAVDPVKLAESQRESDTKLRKSAVKIFESMGMSKDAAAAAASTYGEEAA